MLDRFVKNLTIINWFIISYVAAVVLLLIGLEPRPPLLLPLLSTVCRRTSRDKEGEKRDKIDAFPLTAYLLSDEVKGMKA